MIKTSRGDPLERRNSSRAYIIFSQWQLWTKFDPLVQKRNVSIPKTEPRMLTNGVITETCWRTYSSVECESDLLITLTMFTTLQKYQCKSFLRSYAWVHEAGNLIPHEVIIAWLSKPNRDFLITNSFLLIINFGWWWEVIQVSKSVRKHQLRHKSKSKLSYCNINAFVVGSASR